MNIQEKKKLIRIDALVSAITFILSELLLGLIFGHLVHLIWIIPITCVLSWVGAIARFNILHTCVDADSLILKDNKVIRVFEEDTWLNVGEFTELLKGAKFYKHFKSHNYTRVKSSVKIVLGTTPVRLREISYEAIIARPETLDGFLQAKSLVDALEARCVKNFDGLGTYVCNEFNEKKFTELASLYNPADPGQKQQLQTLLAEFITEMFGEKTPLWIGRGTSFSA